MADANELLRLLQAHGEQFMTSFSSHPARSNIKAQPSDTPHSSDEGSEWGGIDQSSQEEEQDSLDEYSDYNDDEFVQGSSTAPHVVIHSEPKAEKSKDHANGKLFMSPRISKLRSDKIAERKITDEHETDERSNIENDALLYRLVHTKLLSGSLSSDLELTHAQRQKALSGRVLELSGSAKLGRGEKTVRNEEHNKASKRVREGLLSKEKQRRKARLEEAKNLGNYHPKLKRLFEDSRIEKKPQKRQRGLQMGIGHFSGGTLKLSRDEIDMVHGQSSRQKRSRLHGRR
ncbi:hypothetical protein E1B28_004443 [Marasmius oreades]|uniref:Uncharacterized protein n=1 Tax=Marasmius oreades TaxID=181124 RepID=A0A9P7UYN0_9AGAR|nr:uncharacterized protein E1B28_004443 [Marasmius oreades]KAG7097052.1 hypothetical protein E1B28_004443 [Marasmius oreades]